MVRCVQDLAVPVLHLTHVYTPTGAVLEGAKPDLRENCAISVSSFFFIAILLCPAVPECVQYIKGKIMHKNKNKQIPNIYNRIKPKGFHWKMQRCKGGN